MNGMRVWGLAITLALASSLAPHGAEAQGKLRHIGYLSPGPPPGGGFHAFEPFREGLAEAGYVAGQSVVIHELYASGKDHLLADLASELVRRKTDVIVTVGDQATAAAGKATRDIPIVMAVSTDPVGIGLVASLARPGGNITGMTYYVDRILRGAKPTDLPVEQPTKLYLTVNLRTAKTLGLTIPPSPLFRVDEVIE